MWAFWLLRVRTSALAPLLQELPSSVFQLPPLSKTKRNSRSFGPQQVRDRNYMPDDFRLQFDVSFIRMALKKTPYFFAPSVNKIKGLVEIILATKIYTVSSIVAYPNLLSRSIDKRIKPRLHVFEYLNTRNLIKKWPSLGMVDLPDERFYGGFVAPYPNEIGENSVFLIGNFFYSA